MGLTILEGSIFCICDEIGDLDGQTSGLFAEDTRFLSRLELRIDGARPLLLSSGKVEYFSAAFYMRNPVVPGLPQDTLSISRARFVGEGMQDHLVLRNEGNEELAFELGLAVGADFADIISVKEHDFALGNPLTARPLPETAPVRYDAAANQLVLEERGAGGAKTQVLLSRFGDPLDSGVCFRLRLPPRESWDLRIDIVPSLDGEEAEPQAVERRFGEEREHVQESLAAWHLRVPRLQTRREDLRYAFQQSVADLAALRMRGDDGLSMLPAAGMPWFMTVFGRDTIVTCLQTMLLGPELAIASLDALAALQAREDSPSIDAEPGKIVHEVRRGRAAETWFARYYGTVDATPLFLVLLSEVWRWTGDAEVAERLQEPALAALRWIDEFGDRDGDGFVEYARRTPRGLENQSWKDSGDSQRFHDGAFAAAPIAPCRGPGLRLRRQAADRGGRPRRLAGRRAREPARVRGGRPAATLRRCVLGRRAGRLLRARARRREAGRRLALLEHRPLALERDRAARASQGGRGAADGRGALVGVGDTDDVDRGRRLQPAQLPQRHRLAPRHLARCVGARTRRSHGGAAPDRACAPRGGALLRLVAAGGVRRLRARRDAVPDRLPDGGAAASVGGRHACADVAAPARTRARSRGARAAQRDGAARLGGGARARRDPRFRAEVERARRRRRGGCAKVRE